jgi:hypothetical protein
MPNTPLYKKSKISLSNPQKKTMLKVLELNNIRRKKEFVVEELKDRDRKFPNSKTMNALVTKGFLKVRPSNVNVNVLYYQWTGLEPENVKIVKISNRDKLNEIKQMYWNPKWDSMTFNEKMIDPMYGIYIDAISKFFIEFIISHQTHKLSKDFVLSMESAMKFMDSLECLNGE